MIRPRAFAIAAAVLLACSNASAQPRQADLVSLDLADLMQMDVTISSAARRAQAGGDAAAAVFVLTRDDIRRSGAQSIPEALRSVPGLQVARVTNQVWMVTARGFSTRFANKLLVLVDGRSIYTQNFSGVMWEDQHVPLEEIERIEVVRGPGGALWGANAVNGIINIITRTAEQSRGLTGTLRASQDGQAAGLHYGAALGQLGHHRTYIETVERDSFEHGLSPWQRLQAGWRFDGDNLRLQADAYQNDQSAQRSVDRLVQFDLEGGAVSAGWQEDAFNGGLLDLQSYYSWAEYTQSGSNLGRESSLGFDFQSSAPRFGRHLLAMGGGYRKLRDDLRGLTSIGTSFVKPSVTQDLWNLYVQDEIHFLDDALRVTVGAKLEGFKYTGDELQPTLRAIWHLNEEHAVWAAVSTAVRTPARFDLHGSTTVQEIPSIPPMQIMLMGNPSAKAEYLEAYEAGWRWRPAQRVSFDLAVFQHQYRDLAQGLPTQPYFDPSSMRVVVPFTYMNSLDLHTRGAELAMDWRVLQSVRLQASGTWFRMSGARAPQAVTGPEDSDAQRQFSAGLRIDLPRQTELHLAWRWVDERPAWDIPSYANVNLRLASRLIKNLELALSVENLLNKRHVEFFDERGLALGSTLERNASAEMKWHFGGR